MTSHHLHHPSRDDGRDVWPREVRMTEDTLQPQKNDQDDESGGSDTEELRNQPLLDSMRSLVNKERMLADLRLEEKEREAAQWKVKFLELQQEVRASRTLDADDWERNFAVREGKDSDASRRRSDDWDNLQASSKKPGDKPWGILRKLDSMDLSNRKIGAQELNGVISKLKWLKTLTSINLSGNCLDDTCQQPLKVLLSLGRLRYLDFRDNDLGPAAAAVVITSLPRCVNLQVLRLESNLRLAKTPGIGGQLAAGIRAAKKSGSCKQLWSLTVTLNDFDNNSFLRTNNDGRSKKLGKNGGHGSAATADGTQTVTQPPKAAEAGETTRNSSTIPMSATAPAPAHPMNALALVRAFHPRAPGGSVGAASSPAPLRGSNPRPAAGPNADNSRGNGRDSGKCGSGGIMSLGLPYARLHQRTVVEIANHVLPSLTHLDLSYCYIGPSGAAALARSLNGRRPASGGGSGSEDSDWELVPLRSLRLPHNAIGDPGARALGRVLETNRHLTSLSLASNCIGRDGGCALAGSLERSRLDNREHRESGEGEIRTRKRGREERGGVGLVWLDVGDNPLGEKASRLLVAAANGGSGSGGGRGSGDTSLDEVVESGGGQTAPEGSRERGTTTITTAGQRRGSIQIVGLDRVAGATVSTRVRALAPYRLPASQDAGTAAAMALRSSKNRAATARTRSTGGDGEGEIYTPSTGAGGPLIAAVEEEVHAQLGDEDDDPTGASADGFVQVYQARLDTDGNELSRSSAACTNTATKPVNDNSLFGHINNSRDNNSRYYSDDGGDEENGARGGGIVLDITWCWHSTAAATTATNKTAASGRCHATSLAWRVSRSRNGEDRDFVVKEGVGVFGRDSGAARQSSAMKAGADVAAPAKATAMSSAGLFELDAGEENKCSLVETVCNGWKNHDVLKIYVRPVGGSSVTCRDLVVRRLCGRGAMRYGVLWSDADSGCSNAGRTGWRGEDVGRLGSGRTLECAHKYLSPPPMSCGGLAPRVPTVPEKLQVALQLANYPPQPQSPASTDTDPIGTNVPADGPSDGYTTPAHDSDACGVFRLRQVHVAFGGRLTASWEAALFDHNSIRGRDNSYDFGARCATNGGRRRGICSRGGTPGQISPRQRPCGYSWAIVRTRCGEGGGGGGGITSITAAPHSRPRIVSAGVVREPGGTGGEGHSNDCRMVKTDVLSPWEWHRIEADTDSWLPGDVLSLWAKVDGRTTGSTIVDYGSNRGSHGGNCAGNKTRALGHDGGYHMSRDSSGGDSETPARDGFFGPPLPPPLVRGFVVREIDDVRSAEIAGRVRSPYACRRDDGRGGSLCGASSGCSSSSGGYCRRLDFAAVCPMNMAAAGGSWQ